VFVLTVHMKRRSAPLVARDTLALLTGGRTCTSSGVKHIDHQHHNDTANPSTPTNDDIFDNIRQPTSTEQSYCITLHRTTITRRPTNRSQRTRQLKARTLLICNNHTATSTLNLGKTQLTVGKRIEGENPSFSRGIFFARGILRMPVGA
jgi:hypothetical protein